MSFANLLRNAPTQRIKVKGGATQGRLEKPEEKISIDRFTPSVGKGSEYAAKFRAEDDKAYYESVMASTSQDITRIDLTSEASSSNLFQPEELTSVGTIPNLRELNREELTQVYNNYSFTDLEPTEHLQPIHNERDKILRLIENNQVSIIKGPTGCGKSTQIPQFILESYVKRGMHCNIVVTQPRRIAAITIAQHVAQERKWEVGGLVGYQVALDKSASPDTRLLYCTTGVLLEKLISAKELNEYTHILLDEVHEREEDMDFTMLIVKRFLRTNSPHVKVVLMSATIDVSRFAKYFEVTLRNEKQPAPYYEIEPESKFKVQVHYLDALKQIGELPHVTFEEPGISKEAYALVPMMIQCFNGIDEADYMHKRSSDEKGAVLIFLPGLHQIEALFEILTDEDSCKPGVFNFWLCPLHSSITKSEQEKVRSYAPPGKRKVILSTNIAESSITIPDVKYVIDFCLTKHLVADPVTGFTSLQMAWASHTNCIQREGRVGRVQDGRVYRMVPKGFYLHLMAKECLAEMQRCPLEIIVLKCKRLMETECPLRLISCALDPPDLDNYEKTILKLKEIGALLITCRGEITRIDGDLTFLGRVMAALPLDIHITKLILLGHLFGVLEEAIIMGCAMSVRNIFSEPFQKRLQAYNNKLLWADSSESDPIAYLNAYTLWRQLTGIGKFNRARNAEESWARRYMVQIKHLHEVAKQEEDIKKRLKHFNIETIKKHGKPLWETMEKPLILKLVLAGAFYPHFYSRNSQNSNMEFDAVKTLSGCSPYNSVYVQNMPHPAPLYLDQVKQNLRDYEISEEVSLYHDDSRKLVICFESGKDSEECRIGDKNFHMNIPGDIVMPVYRAIKLRQLNISISIKTLPAKAAKEELTKLSLHSRGPKVPDISNTNNPIPITSSTIDFELKYLESAGHFYIWLNGNTDAKHIQQILNNPHIRPVKGEFVDEIIYIAPYRDSENAGLHYYRAKIRKTFLLDDEPWVEVYFIDYGNSAKMEARELREMVNPGLQEELNNIPPCAVECVLAEVCPSVWSDLGGTWSEKAHHHVHRFFSRREIYIGKVFSYVNRVLSLYVYSHENPRGENPPTLNKELIEKGFAMPREESYFSKLNHAKRLEMEEMDTYDTMKNDDKESVTKSFTKDLLSLPTTCNRSIVQLKGPNSPLEMRLFSMVRCSAQKDVKVEWNSVNSVLLDPDPSDPHERLLVAGSVSQSPDGRKLTLNHTTVLPNLHGLAALICLMFAPCVELRSDDHCSRYTGALCGLGMGPKGVPLFSENDMEVCFDVEFSQDDLLHVNKLRYWFNQRYCSDDPEGMPDTEILKIQSNIKQFAISLLKTTRRSMRVHRNLIGFQWGYVPEYLRCDPLLDLTSPEYAGYVYKLHYGIKLDPDNDRTDIEAMVRRLENLLADVADNIIPREMKCELCEVHFDYFTQLRMHLTTSYHMQLEQWLERRAHAHGLSIVRPVKVKNIE